MPYIIKPDEFMIRKDQVSSMFKKKDQWFIVTQTGKEFKIAESEADSIAKWLTASESGNVNSYDKSLKLWKKNVYE